jgi:hypothetical protein
MEGFDLGQPFKPPCTPIPSLCCETVGWVVLDSGLLVALDVLDEPSRFRVRVEASCDRIV